MKIVIKWILFSVLFVSGISAATGQERKVGNGIYILPTQLIFQEILLSYERFVAPRWSLTYSAGYKIPGSQDTLSPLVRGAAATYEYQYMFNKVSNGIYLSVAPAYHLTNRMGKRYYLQTEFFYRHYWFDDKKIIYNPNDDELTGYFNAVRSEKVHVFGLKALIGINKDIRLSDTKVINAKFYVGQGFRIKRYYHESIDKRSLDGTIFKPYEEERGDIFAGSLQLGVKIGLANIYNEKAAIEKTGKKITKSNLRKTNCQKQFGSYKGDFCDTCLILV